MDQKLAEFNKWNAQYKRVKVDISSGDPGAKTSRGARQPEDDEFERGAMTQRFQDPVELQPMPMNLPAPPVVHHQMPDEASQTWSVRSLSPSRIQHEGKMRDPWYQNDYEKFFGIKQGNNFQQNAEHFWNPKGEHAPSQDNIRSKLHQKP